MRPRTSSRYRGSLDNAPPPSPGVAAGPLTLSPLRRSTPSRCLGLRNFDDLGRSLDSVLGGENLHEISRVVVTDEHTP